MYNFTILGDCTHAFAHHRSPTCIPMHMHTPRSHTHAQSHIQTHTHTHTHARLHMHTRIHAHTHTYTGTNTLIIACITRRIEILFISERKMFRQHKYYQEYKTGHILFVLLIHKEAFHSVISNYTFVKTIHMWQSPERLACQTAPRHLCPNFLIDLDE
jgi:hypothetical protein